MKLRILPLTAPVRLRLAVCADFHSVNREMHLDRMLSLLRASAPDLILCPGDFFNFTEPDVSAHDCFNENAFQFLKSAAEIAPVYYSIGNHEHAITRKHRAEIETTGAVFLDNEFVRRGELVIGGYTSGFLGCAGDYKSEHVPDTDFPLHLAREEGYKILLSHHPEYWEKYIRGHGIDLVVAGHAHGGQWRIFGRGVFAPGQGLFPEYTSGIYRYPTEEKTELLAVTRGMSNTLRFVPRFFNPTEILVLDLSPEAIS